MKSFNKKQLAAICSAILLCGAFIPSAHAKSEVQLHAIDDVIQSEDFQSRLGDFRFTFGSDILGSSVGTFNVKRTTNGVLKTDKDACEWAFISALLELKRLAQEKDGIAVEAIQSTITGTQYISSTHYQCLTGHTNSRVYLQGTTVKLNEE